MIKFIITIFAYFFGSLVLSAADTFLPLIPPAAPTTGTLIALPKSHIIANNQLIFVIVAGIGLGIGTSIALYIIRKIKGKILEKLQNQKLNNIQEKFSVFIHAIGDYMIIIGHSLGLGTPVSYVYVLVDEVDYVKYTLYSVIGRSMFLILFVTVLSFTHGGSIVLVVCVVIVYVIAYLIFAYLVFKHRIEIGKSLKQFKRKKRT